MVALAEESTPLLTRERLRVAVITTIRRDPRVQEITDVTVGSSRLEAPIPGSRELGVRVAFATTSEERAVIDLGRLADRA